MDLTKYAAIVFGSNNAQYPRASVDAIDDLHPATAAGRCSSPTRTSARNWRDAPDSDQAFLARFGLIVNQDNGTYALTRAGGDFAAPTHPVLRGVDVVRRRRRQPDRRPGDAAAGRVDRAHRRARETQTRNNDGTTRRTISRARCAT